MSSFVLLLKEIPKKSLSGTDEMSSSQSHAILLLKEIPKKLICGTDA